jgi:aryl-alcohol dehydrogenase-like predicted oxidoreductase
MVSGEGLLVLEEKLHRDAIDASMTRPAERAGVYAPAGAAFALKRIGYGTMQLPGPMVWGPPRDHAEALAVLREALALGINHIDTSDYYGPHVANQLVREALAPYPDDLVIITKVGGVRGPDKSWGVALSRAELISAVHDNLRNLGVDAIDVVNLRVGTHKGPNEDSIAEPLSVLIELQQQGLIKHLGLSNISSKQLAEGRAMASIACVQNHYNVIDRQSDPLIAECAAHGIAFVPYGPLGGFRQLDWARFEALAARAGTQPRQLALAWLLHRAPNVLLIAGTSHVEHLRENVAAGAISLSPDILKELEREPAA